MKLLVITSYYHQSLFAHFCEEIPGETTFCGYEDALEKLLTEEPTHVLFNVDGSFDTLKGNEKAQSILRDLQQSASMDQKVLATSFQRHADIGGDLETRDFLRMPYTAQQLAEFLTGAD